MNKLFVVAASAAAVALSAFSAPASAGETVCRGHVCESTILVGIAPTNSLTAPDTLPSIACPFEGGKMIASDACWGAGISKIMIINMHVNEEDVAGAKKLLTELQLQAGQFELIKFSIPFEQNFQNGFKGSMEHVAAFVASAN